MEERTDETTVIVRGRFVEFMLTQLKLHSLPIMLLFCGIYYFHNENMRMRTEIRTCNESLMEEFRDDRRQMMEIINNNTEALHRIGIYQYKNSNAPTQ